MVMLLIFTVSKFFQFNFLPAKYFGDSITIMRFMEYMPSHIDGSYRLTAKIFNLVNFFGFKSLLQWAIFLSIILGAILFFCIRNIKKISLYESIFIFFSLFLMGVYTFNIGKEPLQFCMNIILYSICINKLSKRKKEFFIFLVLLSWGLFFRIYFILIAILFTVLIFMENHYEKKGYKIDYIKFIGISCAILFALVFFISITDKETYNSIIYVRGATNEYRIGGDSAKTAIVDLINTPNDYINFCLNYVVNMVRMMFPIELAVKGDIKYLMFFLYQLSVTAYFIKTIKKLAYINQEAKIAFFIFTAFVIVSFIFEPDFGSWVRHEVACFPIMILFMVKHNNILSEETGENTNGTNKNTA